MSKIRLIVGLGNPGQEYEFTRHNLGFLVVQFLAKALDIKLSKSPFSQGWTGLGKMEDQSVLLLLPTTFVNLSGLAVQQCLTKKEILPEDLLVICDDLNLEFGQIRIRPDGTAGGHNGLKSIIEHIKTTDFSRLRMGIGSPKGTIEGKDFVLGEFNPTEKKHLPGFIQQAAECSQSWLTQGVTKTMSQFNKRKEDE